MKKILSLLLLFFLLLLCFPVSIFATETKNFSIDQKEFFINTSNQKQISEIVLLKNISAQEIKLTATWEKESIKTDRTIDFATIEGTNLTLQPYSTANIGIKFSVPQNIKSGDYYGNLSIKERNQIQKIPFTIRVLGQLSEKITIRETKFDKDKLLIRVLNEGNITTQVKGIVSLSNQFNSRSYNLASKKLKVGEDSTYIISTPLKIPGFYKASVNLRFGTKDYPVSSFSDFWVNPIFFWISGLTLLLALIFYFLTRSSKTSA